MRAAVHQTHLIFARSLPQALFSPSLVTTRMVLIAEPGTDGLGPGTVKLHRSMPLK